MREQWIKILQTGGARLYGVGTGIVTLAVTSRWLGPEGRGEVAAITTWVNAFSIFFCLSLGQVAIHRASNAGERGWLQGTLSILVFYICVLTLAGWTTAALLYEVTDGAIFGSIRPLWLMLGFLMLPIMMWEQYGSSMLIALERLAIYNRYQVIGRTLTVVAMVLFIPVMGLGVPGALLSYLIGQLMVAVGGIGFLLKEANGIVRPERGDLGSYLKSGLKLHSNAIGAFLFTSADILMLNYYRSSQETGFYQLGVQLMGVMMIIPQAASMIIYGKVVGKGADDAWPEHKLILWQSTGLMILIALLSGITAPWWLIWLAGEAFLPTVDVFRWQLIALVGMSFSTVMAPQWIGRGYFGWAAILTLSVGLGNLVANYHLIPEYGMYGAIWASLGVYSISIIGNCAMVLWCDIEYRRRLQV